MERRKGEMEKLWKKEKEKKWQIWIRVKYGKENKSAVAREYGYRDWSGVSRVIERIESEIIKKEVDIAIKNRIKKYESSMQ